MPAIGPNGKDVYPVTILLESRPNTVEVFPLLVEALSEDEAFGIGTRVGQQVLEEFTGFRKVLCVRVGSCETFDENETKIRLKR